MARRTVVAVAQMTSVGNTIKNWECCERLVKSAVTAGASFLCLPEGFHFIGSHFTQSLQAAESLNGPTITKYKDLAKESSIWLSLGGFQEIGPDEDHVYNSHIVINSNGEIASVYRKIHLFDVDVPNGPILLESKFTAAGNEIVVTETPFATLGLSTCYDLRFPELYCEMSYERGANLLLVPSAFTVPTGKAHWEILLRARAIETQSYLIAAAQVGSHSEKRQSYGHAMIISPWGEILADCGDDENNGMGLIKTASIDLDYLDSLRAKMPCTTHRRKDVFASKI